MTANSSVSPHHFFLWMVSAAYHVSISLLQKVWEWPTHQILLATRGVRAQTAWSRKNATIPLQFDSSIWLNLWPQIWYLDKLGEGGIWYIPMNQWRKLSRMQGFPSPFFFFNSAFGSLISSYHRYSTTLSSSRSIIQPIHPQCRKRVTRSLTEMQICVTNSIRGENTIH